jgi:hypothetical protein
LKLDVAPPPLRRGFAPLTGTADGDLQMAGGVGVFDVHSESAGTALDGTKY